MQFSQRLFLYDGGRVYSKHIRLQQVAPKHLTVSSIMTLKPLTTYQKQKMYKVLHYFYM